MTNQPWTGYIKPSKIFGNLYFAGTRPASTHLIDTGSGLIMIDSGYPQSLYLVTDNIWRLGFRTDDIKYIVISHGHYDHMGATKQLVELTGAKTFIGAEDAPIAEGKADMSLADGMGAVFSENFVPDVLLHDGDNITLGNTTIECISTPGHTDGTMSFFFKVSNGKDTFRAGMFGGAGTNTLTRKFANKYNVCCDEQRSKYLKSIARLEKEHVDIFIGNHVHNNNTEAKLKAVESGRNDAFIDADAWGQFLTGCRLKLVEMIDSGE